MATGIEARIEDRNGGSPPGPYAGLSPYRFNVREFVQILDAGILHPDKRYELLAGFIVEKMTRHEPHDFGVMALGYGLRRLLVDGDWVVREEKTIVLGNFWRPEPDLIVARGPITRYREKHPRAAEIVLVIEVADASYARDRGVKWRRYAATGLPAYGILNLPEKRFELFTKPAGRGHSARYEEAIQYGIGEAFPVVIDGVEVGKVEVAELIA